MVKDDAIFTRVQDANICLLINGVDSDNICGPNDRQEVIGIPSCMFDILSCDITEDGNDGPGE